MKRALLFLLALSTAAACATNAPAGTSPSPVPAHRVGQISRAELDGQRGRRLIEAIRAIDASLLLDRGEPLQVWVDGSALSLSALETLSANDVQTVKRVSAMDARQLFGDRANGAGIVIATRGNSAR